MGSTPHTLATTDSAEDRLERDSVATRLERLAEQRLLYGVSAQTMGRRNVRIIGRVDDETAIAWGFYGGVLTAVAGLVGLTYQGYLGLWNVGPTLLWSVVALFGILIARFGRRSTMEEREVASIDLVDRILTIKGDETHVVDLDQITEIVFGLTRYPISGDKNSVRVQAASVLVRVEDDRLATVVNACTDKDATYGVARFLSSLTGFPVKQVGEGVK